MADLTICARGCSSIDGCACPDKPPAPGGVAGLPSLADITEARHALQRGETTITDRYLRQWQSTIPEAATALTRLSAEREEARGHIRSIRKAHGNCVCGSFECSVVSGGGCLGDALHTEIMKADAFLTRTEPRHDR